MWWLEEALCFVSCVIGINGIVSFIKSRHNAYIVSNAAKAESETVGNNNQNLSSHYSTPNYYRSTTLNYYTPDSDCDTPNCLEGLPLVGSQTIEIWSVVGSY